MSVKCVAVFSVVVDWIIADMLAIRQSALGHVRYVLKDGLKWLPLYGWYFSQVMQLSEYEAIIFSNKALNKEKENFKLVSMQLNIYIA